MKTCLLNFVCLFSFLSNTQGQGKYLDVPIIGQLDEQLCWAASMQMIDEYYGGILTQCNFAKQYYFYDTNSPFTASCSNVCQSIPIDLNKSIGYPRHPNKYDSPHYFDMIFNYFGYNSIEDIEVHRMDWIKVIKEIDGCRPFLVVLNKVDSRIEKIEGNELLPPYYHVMVAKGYHLFKDSKMYVLANDPQNDANSCGGCEYLLPISVFTQNYGEFNTVREVVRAILPQNEDICCYEKCKGIMPSDSSDLIKLAKNSTFISITQPTIPGSYLQSLLSGTTYSFNDITYADLETNHPSIITKTVKLIIDHQIGIYLEDEGTDWGVRGITKIDCTPFNPANIPEFFVLENEYVKPKKINYIVVLPYNIEFYKVELNDKTYLSPVRDYSDTEVGFKFQQLYPENEIYKRLREVFSRELLNKEPDLKR